MNLFLSDDFDRASDDGRDDPEFLDISKIGFKADSSGRLVPVDERIADLVSEVLKDIATYQRNQNLAP